MTGKLNVSTHLQKQDVKSEVSTHLHNSEVSIHLQDASIILTGHARAGAREKTLIDAEFWRLEPHICRSCFSRLVSQTTGDGDGRYQCTNCGLEAVGPGADVLCCCGLKIRRPTKLHKSGHHLMDAGVRCGANPDLRPDFPSLFVAVETDEMAGK